MIVILASSSSMVVSFTFIYIPFRSSHFFVSIFHAVRFSVDVAAGTWVLHISLCHIAQAQTYTFYSYLVMSQHARWVFECLQSSKRVKWAIKKTRASTILFFFALSASARVFFRFFSLFILSMVWRMHVMRYKLILMVMSWAFSFLFSGIFFCSFHSLDLHYSFAHTSVQAQHTTHFYVVLFICLFTTKENDDKKFF